jgi:hypothetical protein
MIPVPAEVKSSEFGCRNCLYYGCECTGGSRYVPAYVDGVPSCRSYVYFD